MTWLHSNVPVDYTFNGNVVEATGPVHATGRVQSVIGNEAVVYFEQTGEMQRYTLLHGKVVVEGFSKAALAAGKTDSFGLGELVKPKGS